MPPKPRTGQIRKPEPRRRKPNTINLQLAVGQSMDYTATAVNPGATSAMPLLPFLAPMPSSAPAPISDAPMAREYVDLYNILPPPSSHSTSSVLPSPSLTDEASPASAHAPAEPYEQQTTAPAETAMVLPSTHETITYQTTNSQNGAIQRPAQESNQPTREETPLHTAVIWAISVIRQRAEEFKDGKCPANNAEQSRYTTLLNACHSLDAVFLIVHQQCCCWKLDRKAAYAALVPIPPELIDIAFSELCSVFSDDKHMQITDPHWQWFSNFPGFRNVVGLDRIYIQAKDFIAAFAMHWPAMKKSLLSQMIPPMAYQIRDILRCVSNTIASALFKRIRKTIGIPDGPMSARLNHLFTMDNRQELNFEEQSVPQEEMDRVRSTMMTTYVTFVRETREEQARLAEVGAVSAAPAANTSHRIPPFPSSNHANINTNININRLAAPSQQQPPSQGPPQCQAPDTTLSLLFIRRLSPQRISKTNVSPLNLHLNFHLNLSISLKFYPLSIHLNPNSNPNLNFHLSLNLNLNLSINLRTNSSINVNFHLGINPKLNPNLSTNLSTNLSLNLSINLNLNISISLNINLNSSPSSPVYGIQLV
ncbi:hypothetical protein T069G_00888 [Trichoderma breve]|uniref:Uncharacterized protein n=1 Tax=Trichoderma breve TaxID=2034170 RepID=A0A9W9JQU4_9HYPO|nr:hypothetical protein T069G_00888 [Trichoderma breve]KAJ4864358.1 hypothetical protein T069G_00888 [Trichoderma breve]